MQDRHPSLEDHSHIIADTRWDIVRSQAPSHLDGNIDWSTSEQMASLPACLVHHQRTNVKEHKMRNLLLLFKASYLFVTGIVDIVRQRLLDRLRDCLLQRLGDLAISNRMTLGATRAGIVDGVGNALFNTLREDLLSCLGDLGVASGMGFTLTVFVLVLIHLDGCGLKQSSRGDSMDFGDLLNARFDRGWSEHDGHLGREEEGVYINKMRRWQDSKYYRSLCASNQLQRRFALDIP